MDEDLDLDDGEIPFFTTSGSRESSPDSEDFMQGKVVRWQKSSKWAG